MRYCLLSRFQGAWLGSVLGEALTTKHHSGDRLKIINARASQWLTHRNNIAIAIVNQDRLPEKLPLNSNYSLIALLPLILLGHENLKFLQTSVVQFTEPNLSSVLDNVLLWGYAISLALREKLDADNPIEQILAGVGAELTSPNELQMINLALKENRALNEVVEKLLVANPTQAALAASLYCFASVPQDFYLAIFKARSITYGTFEFKQTIVLLTATLSGAYNSLAGIPASWQMFGSQNQIYRQEKKTAVDLFNNWLGAYFPQKLKNDGNITVVATPKTIQPRSTLNIVSQTDY